VESEVRDGMKSFADEIDKVIHEVRSGEAAKKIKEEAGEVRTKVESGELPAKARGGFGQGLRWLSEELGKLADQVSPVEKAPTEPMPEAPAAEEPQAAE